MSVDSVILLGDDQLANSYQIVFPAGIPGAKNPDAIALRMDQSFDPPEESVTTYDIKYRGIIIRKTGRAEGTSKEFAVDIRLDQQWQVLTDLRNLYEMSYNPINGQGMGDMFARFPISIQALNGAHQVVKTIAFKNCKIKSLKVNSFGQEEEGPTRINASFIYGTMTYE